MILEIHGSSYNLNFQHADMGTWVFMEISVKGKSMDVGVDSYYHLFGKYTLFTYDDIKNILLKR